MTERYSWTVNLMQINLMQINLMKTNLMKTNLMKTNLMKTNNTDITTEISGKEGNCSDRGSIALSCERV